MQFLTELMKQWGLADQQAIWISQVFIVVTLTLIAHVVAVYLLGHLETQLKRTRTLWDDIIVSSFRKPLGLLIWLIGLLWAAEIAREQADDAAIFGFIEPLRDVGVVLLMAWSLVRLIANAEEVLINPPAEAGRDPGDPTTVHAAGKLLRVSVSITAVLVVLQSMGYSVSGVLAFGGVGGIAIGFAAKDLLANFFGGLMIYLDKPFRVGDWIRSPDKEIEGTVEYIGWRLSRIRTFDKRPLYVPNALFASIAIENPSRMTNRRIMENVGIRYDDIAQMEAIVAGVRRMLENHDEIDHDKTLIVNFNAFSASSVDFLVYTFTKTTNWVRFHEIKQDVLLKISQVVADHGAEIAFPTRTLHIPDSLHLEHAEPAAAQASA